MGDEAAGPIAHLLPVPDPGSGTGDDDDPLGDLRRDIRSARGRSVVVETTSAGWGDAGAAPRRDWVPSRLGPAPPAALADLRRDTFVAVLSAAGCPPALFDPGGTAQGQRESWRRFGAGTVLPLARMLAHELTAKLETDIRLRFDDLAAADTVGKSAVYRNLRGAGMDDDEARRLAGLA